MTPEERRELLAAVDLGELLVELTGIEPRGRQYACPSVGHAQTGSTPPVSLGRGDGCELWRCHACGAGGTAIDALVARGAGLAGAITELRRRGGGGGGGNPSDTPAHAHTCTIEQYAKAKRLPVTFLRELGISDYTDPRFEGRVLRIPYRDGEGSEPAVRLRIALGGGNRFLWRKGSRPCLYGLWRLACARVQAGGEGANPPPPSIVLVEGESDAQTLWYHGISALGLPGAGTWEEGRDLHHFDGIERIYVVIEPDHGGKVVLGWLARSKLCDRAWLVELPGGDVSALYLADPERFEASFQTALDAAEPWRSRAAQVEDAERRELEVRCRDLANTPRVLDRFAADLRKLGVVGEERLAKLVYLAVTSRLLDRIVSVGVKGPSAAGKSVTVEQTLRFFPSRAFYVLTAMSERGLIFIQEDMAHRMLVLYEAAGMAGDLQTYLIRSLLSEGRIRYLMPAKAADGKIEGRLLELEGPTGLLVTTTAISLHPENETRLLSVTATDSRVQTARVLAALADEDQQHVDLDPWHALQRWLALGKCEVTIPYAKQLAAKVPPVAVRLRRDFSSVLGLIRAHALLHQATREWDNRGRIVATIEDYGVVRGLVVDLISEGVQATVTPEVRETVEVVGNLDREQGTSRQQIAKALKLDPSAAGRRLQSASAKGYLRNLETSRGKPARWVLGDPLPNDQEVLPAPDAFNSHDEQEPCPPLAGWTLAELEAIRATVEAERAEREAA